MNAQELEAEIAKRVEDMTPELLPQLLERFLVRQGLVECARHGQKLLSYVRAQIALTRAKRNNIPNHNSDCTTGYYPSEIPQIISDHYNFALKHRNDIRKDYRSTPCTCWVRHR